MIPHRKIALLCTVCFTMVLTASAQVPGLFNYQGRLVEDGALANGTTSMVFRLHNEEIADSMVYVETQDVVVVDGLYSVDLGGSLDFSFVDVLSNAMLYLEVQVGLTTLAPRERLLSVPYAVMAEQVEAGAITTAMLEDGAVTGDKLGQIDSLSVLGTVTAGELALGNAAGDNLSFLRGVADGGVSYLSSVVPADRVKDVWCDENFVYAAADSLGLQVYAVDAAGTLSLLDTQDQGGTANGVFGDGQYIYVADGNNGLHSYSVDGAGTLTYLDTHDPGGYAFGVWGDGTHVFLAAGAEGLHSYFVEGNGDLSHVDAEDPGGMARGVAGVDGIVYLASDSEGVHSYSVDGSGNLTHLQGQDTGENAYEVWADDSFVYVAADTAGLHVYATHELGALSLLDTASSGTTARGVWNDDQFVYLAAGTGGLVTYEINSAGQLTEQDTDVPGGSSYSVFGNGRFVYLADGDSGLHSYARDLDGFEVAPDTTGSSPDVLFSGNVLADTMAISGEYGESYPVAGDPQPGYLHLVDTYHNPTGRTYGAWSDGSLVFSANGTNGLLSYQIDAEGHLTFIDSHLPGGGSAEDVWGDDTWIYLANGSGGLHLYSANSTGGLTHIDSYDHGETYDSVWSDDNFVYVSADTGGVHSFSVDGGGNLDWVDTEATEDVDAIWGDGRFLYAVDVGDVNSYSIDDAGMITLLDNSSGAFFLYDVWSQGSNLYTVVQSSGSIRRWTVSNTGQLTSKGVETTEATSASDIWGQNSLLYLIGGHELFLYSTENPDELRLLDRINVQSNWLYGVWGNEDYIFVSGADGLTVLESKTCVTLGDEDTPIRVADNLVVDGRLGIGTRAPEARLHIAHTGTTDTVHFKMSSGSSPSHLVIDSEGNMGLGVEAPEELLHVDGRVYLEQYCRMGDNLLVGNSLTVSNSLTVEGNAQIQSIASGAYAAPVNQTSDGTLTTATSDKRFKEDIHTIQSALDKVTQLRGVEFTWKDDPALGPRIGLVAQEVENVVPEAVFTNPHDGYKGVLYGELVSVLVEAIKEQQAHIDRLEERINELDDR